MTQQVRNFSKLDHPQLNENFTTFTWLPQAAANYNNSMLCVHPCNETLKLRTSTNEGQLVADEVPTSHAML